MNIRSLAYRGLSMNGALHVMVLLEKILSFSLEVIEQTDSIGNILSQGCKEWQIKLPEAVPPEYYAKLCSVNWFISPSNVYTRSKSPEKLCQVKKIAR